MVGCAAAPACIGDDGWNMDDWTIFMMLALTLKPGEGFHQPGAWGVMGLETVLFPLSTFMMSAYEDTFYYLWRERKLPVNVDPLDSKIEDPIERNRIVGGIACVARRISVGAILYSSLGAAESRRRFETRSVRR